MNIPEGIKLIEALIAQFKKECTPVDYEELLMEMEDRAANAINDLQGE